MGLIRVSYFAKEVGCSPQNIYKHIRNYAQDLEGHLMESRRGLMLDEYAQEFIRGVMYPKELSAEASGIQAELEAMRRDYFQLGKEHAALASRLAQVEGERDRALLEAGENQRLLLASKEAEEAKAQELATAQERTVALQGDLQAAQEALAAAQARHERLMARGLWARLTNQEVE